VGDVVIDTDVASLLRKRQAPPWIVRLSLMPALWCAQLLGVKQAPGL